MITKDYIVDAAREAGFDLCGVARARELAEYRGPFARWLEAGYHSTLGYMARNIDKRFDPAVLAEGAQAGGASAGASGGARAGRASAGKSSTGRGFRARTVVVCAVSYKSAAALGQPGALVGEAFASAGTAHHCEAGQSLALECEPLDSQPISEVGLPVGSPADPPLSAVGLSVGSPVDPPKVAAYALARDYHPTIKGMLEQVLDRIREAAPGVSGRCFCDTAPLLEKAWAVEAGLGWQGCNALVINPQFGSFILLGELVIDAEVESYSEPFRGDRCGECRLCIDHCPNGAIVSPRVVDTNRCISRLTVEAPGEGRKSETPGVGLAEAERPGAGSAGAERLGAPEGGSGAPGAGGTVGASHTALHGWIFGCDICQGVCPWNQRSPVHTNPAFDPVIDPRELTREFWLSLSRERFEQIFRQTPLARRGYDQIIEKIK